MCAVVGAYITELVNAFASVELGLLPPRVLFIQANKYLLRSFVRTRVMTLERCVVRGAA